MTLSGETDQDVTFSYSTFDGTKPAAHAGVRLHRGERTVRARSGGFDRRVRGGHNQGDKDVKESDENFFVTISNPQNARLGGPTTQITLRNDDK